MRPSSKAMEFPALTTSNANHNSMPATLSPPIATADQELCRRVLGELAETQRLSLKRLGVEVRQGIVHLRGCVKSFYEKQLAIRSCIRAAGAGRLVDAVEVPAG